MIAMINETWTLILLLAAVFGALAAIAAFSNRGSLDNIKSRDVGDGQHGTARWATPDHSSPRCGGRGNSSRMRRGWCWAVWERTQPRQSSTCWAERYTRLCRKSCGSTAGSGPW